MPVYLPPISRRQFLTRSLAASLGLALAPSLFAARRKTDPNTWALLSDTHIDADRARLHRNINPAGNLNAVAREILAFKKNPAGMLVSGDLALNHGEPGDYATLTDLLQPLRSNLPIHLALGNHDHRERFWQACRESKTAESAIINKQITIVRSPHANWFVLDSLLKTIDTPGQLGDAQLAWLAQALDANADKPAILVLHHNPGEHSGSLQDTKEFLAVIRPRKQVKAWVFGHSHHWHLKTDESGIHLINLPPVAYTFVESDPNGWVHARLERNGIQLELRCLDTAHPQHGKKHQLTWRA